MSLCYIVSDNMWHLNYTVIALIRQKRILWVSGERKSIGGKFEKSFSLGNELSGFNFQFSMWESAKPNLNLWNDLWKTQHFKMMRINLIWWMKKAKKLRSFSNQIYCLLLEFMCFFSLSIKSSCFIFFIQTDSEWKIEQKNDLDGSFESEFFISF